MVFHFYKNPNQYLMVVFTSVHGSVISLKLMSHTCLLVSVDNCVIVYCNYYHECGIIWSASYVIFSEMLEWRVKFIYLRGKNFFMIPLGQKNSILQGFFFFFKDYKDLRSFSLFSCDWKKMKQELVPQQYEVGKYDLTCKITTTGIWFIDYNEWLILYIVESMSYDALQLIIHLPVVVILHVSSCFLHDK